MSRLFRARPLVLAATFAICFGGVSTNAQETSLEVFSSLPTFSNPVLSPSGKKLAYTTAVDGIRQLVVADPNGANPLLVTPPEKQTITTYDWASDSDLIYGTSYSLKRRTAKSHTIETRWYRLNLETRSTLWLGAPDRSRLDESMSQIEKVVHLLPNDPDHILIALDLNRNGDDEVYKVSLKSGFRKLVQREVDGAVHWHADANADLRQYTGFRGNRRLFRLKTPDGKWKDRNDFPWEHDFTFEGFGNDPGTIYASRFTEDDTLGLYKLDMMSGDILETLFTHPDYDMSHLVYNRNTGKVIGVAYTDHFPKTIYFDESYQATQQTITELLPDREYQILNRSRDGKLYIIKAVAVDNPGHYYVFNKETGTITLLTRERANLQPQHSSVTQFFQVKARDSQLIPAYATFPATKEEVKKLPTVILPHGGPYGVRDDATWDYIAQYLADAGYLVVKPNFRGSGGYGRKFQNTGYNQWGGRMQDDITDVTKWLIEKDISDPGRICIAGASYGGYAALMGTIMAPELYKCAISINGVTDLARQKNNDRLQLIGGKEWTPQWGLDGVSDTEISPYHRVADISVPILLIASIDDARVLHRLSKDMHTQLKKHKKTSRYIEIKQGGHSLNTQHARRKMLQSVGSFLERHIGS